MSSSRTTRSKKKSADDTLNCMSTSKTKVLAESSPSKLLNGYASPAVTTTPSELASSTAKPGSENELLRSPSQTRATTKPQKPAKPIVTLEDKLKQMNQEAAKRKTPDVTIRDRKAAQDNQPPETLAVLLLQGLQSEDKGIIHVLTSTKQNLLHKTVEGIPVQFVIPFIKELIRRFRTSKNLLMVVQWLKATTEVHAAFLISHPEVLAEMTEVQQMLDSRTALLDKVLKLQGKIDLVLHLADAQGSSSKLYATQSAKVVYEDDSSDEEIRRIAAGRGDLEADEDDWGEEFDFSSDEDEADEANHSSQSDESSEEADDDEMSSVASGGEGEENESGAEESDSEMLLGQSSDVVAADRNKSRAAGGSERSANRSTTSSKRRDNEQSDVDVASSSLQATSLSRSKKLQKQKQTSVKKRHRSKSSVSSDDDASMDVE